jgi:drug/metabolite transporter (DMT)-like permease
MPALTGAAAPGVRAWAAIGLVACFSTALGYILYFRLIERVGPQRALTVTFLVPVFGVIYGGLFLGEQLDARSLIGALVVLVGTALALGVFRVPMRPQRAPSSGAEATAAVEEGGERVSGWPGRRS